MPVETAAYLTNLNPSQPQNNDLIKEGDDHIRLLKQVLLNTLPNFTTEVEVSSAELNALKKNMTLTDSGLAMKSTLSFDQDVNIAMKGGTISGVKDAVDDDQVMPKSQVDTILDAQTEKVNNLLKEVENRVSTITNLVYPVGTIYTTDDENFDPASFFGVGVWEKIQGRFLLADGTTSGGGSTYNLGAVGGEADHLLTEPEMPKHHHTASKVFVSGGGAGYDSGPGHTPRTITTTDAGGDKPHNNMPPYLVVRIWRRVS